MNIKAILICINRLSDKQLAHAAIDTAAGAKDAKRTRNEQHDAHIRHLLILNAANERQWQQAHKRSE